MPPTSGRIDGSWASATVDTNGSVAMARTAEKRSMTMTLGVGQVVRHSRPIDHPEQAPTRRDEGGREPAGGVCLVENLAHDGALVFTSNEKHRGARGIEERERRGDARNGGLHGRRRVDGYRPACLLEDGRGAWKERRGVTVGPDAEEGEVDRGAGD